MLNVALAGNPNTGKTTLFNALTGANARVGNYPGITVERRVGHHDLPATPDLPGGARWQVHDLPGCYSLSAHSPEEEIAHHALTGRLGERIDVAVVVLDASNLARNLLLLLQIGGLGIPVVAALNMMDAALAEGMAIDVPGLAEALGVPVVPLVARKSKGLAELATAVQAVAAQPELGRLRLAVPQPPEVLAAVEAAKPVLARHGVLSGVQDAHDQVQAEVLWWLGAHADIAERASPGLGAELLAAVPRGGEAAGEGSCKNNSTGLLCTSVAASRTLSRAWLPSKQQKGLTRQQCCFCAGPDVRRLVAEARYAAIDSLLARHLRRQGRRGRSVSERIDAVLLHPLLGALGFLVAMTLLFQAVFAWAEPAIGIVESWMATAGGLLGGVLPAGLLRDVLVDGVLAGIGATLVFLPQILLLFLGIAVLEDTGYLARTAFLVDRLMARAGLPGKAFVPLLSSFACAVPGIMATRTMSDPRDRLLTILVAPLMSCSARLPVYTLVTAAVFAGVAPVFGFLSAGGLVVAGMYALGFAIALVAAFVLRRTAVRGGGAPLLLEMPPYRMPRWQSILRVLWDRGSGFVVQTGTVIVALSVVLWALMTFPRHGLPEAERARLEQAAATSPDPEAARTAIAHRDSQHRLEHSIAGRLGHAIEPAIAPLGFDWRIGIGLIGSFAAREVLVPIMGQVYGRGIPGEVDDGYADDVGARMTAAGALTPLKGLSLMVFFAIAMQCLSTVATIRRETNSWRWPLFTIGYLNGLAWLASFAVYQGGRALGYT